MVSSIKMTMGNIARKLPKRQWKFKKNIAASVPFPRVWWLGPKRSAALDDGATGGMNAGILLAHIIAAAKVRRQSLQIHNGACELPKLRFLKSSCPATASVLVKAHSHRPKRMP